MKKSTILIVGIISVFLIPTQATARTNTIHVVNCTPDHLVHINVYNPGHYFVGGPASNGWVKTKSESPKNKQDFTCKPGFGATAPNKCWIGVAKGKGNTHTQRKLLKDESTYYVYTYEMSPGVWKMQSSTKTCAGF
ncbi:MAG: hypothetical protein GY829_03990 [Gammaproteobacteria bacterium]|nr:hypothetical protein [Gammaproteobacteria bacterium]